MPGTLLARHAREDRAVQIGIDEAGRGPLFGRVYAAAVVLPDDFDVARVKDSKLYHSERKLREAESHVKERALAYGVAWRDADAIDADNILNATMACMHDAAREAMGALAPRTLRDALLLVDGTYFRPLSAEGAAVAHVLVPKGDSTYAAIAAASVLAKRARDDYIYALCEERPDVAARYDLRRNKGYGTSAHMAAIRAHGVTEWHRRSFRPCR